MQPTPKGAGKTGRPPAVLTDPQYAFFYRWQLHPASTRPPARNMAAALAIGRDTFARRISQQGRGFSPAELVQLNALLDL